MRPLIFLSLLVFSVFSFAGTKEINLGKFSELKVYDEIEVELIQSDKNMVAVSGANAENVAVTLENGKLKIDMKAGKATNTTKVTLYYRADLNKITARGGSKVYSKKMIKQNSLSLRAQEGAKIKVDVAVKNLKVKAKSGGVISGEGIENV